MNNKFKDAICAEINPNEAGRHKRFDGMSKKIDISLVKIDRDLPKEERIADFVRQINDPHHYICGKTTVIVKFADTGKTLEDRLMEFYARV